MLRRILAEHRLALTVLSAALVANLAAFLVIVRPLAARVSGVEGRRALSERALKAAEADLASAEELVKGVERARADLDRFYRGVLPADLNEANRTAYLRLAQMARESNLRFQSRTFAPGHVRDTRFDVLKVAMDLEGSYEDVRRLIHRIEAAEEFFVIDRVALGAGRTPGAALALTLELSTYYRTEGDER